MPEETIESLKQIDLEKLCLDRENFGPLIFSNAFPILEKMKGDLVELEELDYKNQLTKNDLSRVESIFTAFKNLIEKIRTFQVGVGDSQRIHDDIETEVQNFYDTQFSNIYPSLTLLRQNIQLANKTEVDLQKSLKMARKYEKELRDLRDQVSSDLIKLKSETEAVTEGKSMASSKYLSNEFDFQFLEHDKRADKFWFKGIIIFYLSLVGAIIISIIYYFTKIKESENLFKIYEYSALNFLVIAIIYYALNFCSRNYNIQKNLAVDNRHRRNVAETMLNFMNYLSDDKDTKIELVKEGAKAMFGRRSSGYLSKESSQISTPTTDMVAKIISK